MKKSLWKYLASMVSYTNKVILLNVILFFVFWILLVVNPDWVKFIEVNAENIISLKYIWTIITSMFMHQGFLHLFVNMISLFFLGNLSEQLIGRKRFLILYFLSGIFGALLFVFGAWFGSFIGLENVFGSMKDYAAGASGALFGLLGILAVLIPKYRVYLVVGPLVVLILEIVLTPFLPSSAQGIFSVIFSILIVVSIFAMFSRNVNFRKLAVPMALPLWVAPIVAIVPLVAISFFVSLPIGNTAHLGGLIVGLIYGIVLRLKYPKKVSFLERVFAR